jgi:thiamine biosynthesis lipoprotein
MVDIACRRMMVSETSECTGAWMAELRSESEVMSGWDEGISGTVVRDDAVIHVEHVWSTVVTIRMGSTRGRETEAVQAVTSCTDFFADVDRTFSVFKPLSEVSLHRLGLGGGGSHSAVFQEVMNACAAARVLTNGAFDPWAVPGGFDPSGYVKGWAAGRASALLLDAGFGRNLVNAGGDVSAMGDEVPGSGEGWPIGIINPHDTSEVIKTVTLRSEAMATSGQYERGAHVIDPATGATAMGADSATVVGPDAGLADAVASAALVSGLASTEWFGALGPEWSLHLVVGQLAHTYGPAFDGLSESGT